MTKSTFSPTDTKKVMFHLRHRQIAHLDFLLADIRSKTGAVVKRSELLRGVVDALMKSKFSFSGATSEADIAAILTKKLKG